MIAGPRLQLALDLLDLGQALAAARAAKESIDIIEAGTLLCLSEGMRALRSLREAFPDKTLVGDVRIARAGRNIAEMAFDAGADWVSVVGEAPLETIAAAAAVAEVRGGEIQVELYPGWTLEQAQEWRRLGIGQVIFHSTAEVEAMGSGWSRRSLDTVRRLAGMGFRVTVAGGISVETIPLFAGAPAHVFIAGRSIVGAPDPAAAARGFKEALGRLDGATDHRHL